MTDLDENDAGHTLDFPWPAGIQNFVDYRLKQGEKWSDILRATDSRRFVAAPYFFSYFSSAATKPDSSAWWQELVADK